MLKQIILSLPEDIYRQIQRVAITTQSNVTDVLLDTISNTFAPYPVNPNRAAMKKEIAAYTTIHAELAKKYLGQYVAFYQGKLVAYNVDPVALHQHITAKYPGEVVLCRKVQEEAAPVIQIEVDGYDNLSGQWSLSAIVDSGADATMISLPVLKAIGAVYKESTWLKNLLKPAPILKQN